MKILDWVIARLSEKTTWYGVTALLTAAGVAVSPELKEAIGLAGVAVAGLIAVVTKEKTPE